MSRDERRALGVWILIVVPVLPGMCPRCGQRRTIPAWSQLSGSSVPAPVCAVCIRQEIEAKSRIDAEVARVTTSWWRDLDLLVRFDAYCAERDRRPDA